MKGLKFGVIGVGAVGSATVHALSRFYDYEMYDVIEGQPFEPILSCDVVFVCVPTPAGDGGHLDCRAVSEVLSDLDSRGFGGVAVVKSTVRVGFMDSESARHPGLRLVYMPEFLRERNSFSWSVEPDRIVLAGNEEDADLVLSMHSFAERAAVLRMSYAEAEIGKLAHNAFIATKVSFTNTVEAVCSAAGADPAAAMSVVWHDRRVNGSSHLTPGLGGYSGKCVPKDTAELEASAVDLGADAALLRGAREVNEGVAPSAACPCPKVCVVIPTQLKDGLWRRAVSSAASQTQRPDLLVVVHDGAGDVAGLEECVEGTGLDCLVLENEGTGLSGAVNTALCGVRGRMDGGTFVALLDDDDYWSRRYLQTCTSFASDYGCEWVVPGIFREESEGMYSKQPVPETLSVHDFLVGNPNVQGSNMFIRLDALESVGGFREGLVSTTDRDLCIRLLRAGHSAMPLFVHMVHHDCHSRADRLSTPGSPRKIEGLRAFHSIYKGMMTPDEEDAFVARAVGLFGADESMFRRGGARDAPFET